jgi:hypothetical protein
VHLVFVEALSAVILKSLETLPWTCRRDHRSRAGFRARPLKKELHTISLGFSLEFLHLLAGFGYGNRKIVLTMQNIVWGIRNCGHVLWVSVLGREVRKFTAIGVCYGIVRVSQGTGLQKNPTKTMTLPDYESGGRRFESFRAHHFSRT